MTTEKQIPKLVAMLVEHQLEFDSLSVDDAQWVIKNTKEAIAIFNGAIGNRPRSVELLLEFISEVNVPATTEQFIVRARIAEIKKSGQKIYTGSNFEEWFFDQTVKSSEKQKLFYRKLRKSSVDGPIIAELGGETKAETTLAEVFALMEQQPNGEAGGLLTNGYANIFYIRDKNGVLRAVYCSWYDGGWILNARSVENPSKWNDGNQVFSRN